MNLRLSRLPAIPAALALSLLSALPPVASADEGYFVEAGVGYGETTFDPDYTFVDGSPSQSFSDQQRGRITSVGFGYEKALSERFSLAISANLVDQQAEWTLYLPWEPAWFSYEIPRTLGLILTPAWQPAPRWRLFAELGLISGEVKERKYSAVTSHYDADEWVSGLLLGVGVGYRLNDRLEITLGRREMRYDDLTYSTRLPDGSQRATVTDSPTTAYTSLGLRYRF
ncbi:outer membrane protein [Endothiovibrio diazotrophicus]